MRSGGVRVAPEALQRMVDEQPLPAGCEEQRVDRLDQEPRAERLVAAIAQPHVEVDRFTAPGEIVSFGDVAKDQQPCSIDASGGLGDTQLHRRQFRHLAIAAGHRAARGANLCHVEKLGERAFSHAEQRDHDGDRQHREK